MADRRVTAAAVPSTNVCRPATPSPQLLHAPQRPAAAVCPVQPPLPPITPLHNPRPPRSGLQQQFVLFSQAALGAEPAVLLDPNALSDDGTVALRDAAFSDDGRLLAYQVWRCRAARPLRA